MNIILSIHPKWAKLIYEGKKTIEWRKTEPKKADGLSVIFLYETAPVCKVTGWVKFNGANAVDATKEQRPFNWQDIFLEQVEHGCVERNELIKYQGNSDYIYAWMVYDPRKFGTPKTLEDFGLKRPPQSWCYTEVGE